MLPDHRNERSHQGHSRGEDIEDVELEHELIKYLPLLAANDFLESDSDHDPAA